MLACTIRSLRGARPHTAHSTTVESGPGAGDASASTPHGSPYDAALSCAAGGVETFAPPPPYRLCDCRAKEDTHCLDPNRDTHCVRIA